MRAVKSISLIGTRHSHGPNKTANTMKLKTTVQTTASLWRLNLRHDSRPGDCADGLATKALLSVEGDARVEPAIQNIC
jgi:hypothetical protein